MATIPEALASAIQHHQAGRLSQAEQIYRQILQTSPDHADALHLLGLIAYQVGRHDVAIEHLGRAIRADDRQAAFHNSLGAAYGAAGRTAEAVASFQRAVELQPDYGEAHHNLGLAWKARGRNDLAAAAFRRAIQLEPRHAEAYHNLALVLTAQGRRDDAIACYQRAVQLKPDLIDSHSNLGILWLERGNPDDAVLCFQQALRWKPDSADACNNLGIAWKMKGLLNDAAACFARAIELDPRCAGAYNNLGIARKEQKRPDDAVACYQKALELQPDYVDALSNLGNLLRDQGKMDQATACLERALRLKPDYASAQHNLGLARREQGRLDEALACFARAIEAQPDHADAHYNQAVIWLLRGDFDRGWPEYEWRWRMRECGGQGRQFSQPPWDGRPLEGRTILLYAEQGLGDTIQFVRYAPLVKQRGGTVLVECQKALLPLLTRCPGIDRLIARGDALPPLDAHAPLLSLPRIFQTRLETVPGGVPYLEADPTLVQRWRDALGRLEGFKIGIVWQGNPGYLSDRQRSIRLAEFAPLAEVPGVCLISLQKGLGSEQMAALGDRFPVYDLGPLDEQSGPFMDTAAVVKNLDLVVTADTAAGHLAGALGAPVWIALPFVPDWRWPLGRDDSPWYPTVRLFRQERPGDWRGVFERMAAALARHRGERS